MERTLILWHIGSWIPPTLIVPAREHFHRGPMSFAGQGPQHPGVYRHGLHSDPANQGRLLNLPRIAGSGPHEVVNNRLVLPRSLLLELSHIRCERWVQLNS
jgi:hypothetical protein